jgi:hypothetical protein
MKTRESFQFRNIIEGALSFRLVRKAIGAKGQLVDTAKQDAAFKAWEKRVRNHAEGKRHKAEAHRLAGEETEAGLAQRSAERADKRIAKRAAVLEAHRRARVAGAPPPAVVPKAPPPPPPPRVAGPGAEARQPDPPAPKPVEKMDAGDWDKIVRQYGGHKDLLNKGGFQRIEFQPLEKKPNGKLVGHEVLEHRDGRKIEFHITFDPKEGKGSVRTIEHAAPPTPPMSRPIKHPQKSVKTQMEVMLAAHKNPDLLQNGKVDHLGGGASGSYKATFKDGTMAAYKPDAEGIIAMGWREHLEKSLGESHRELVCYKISNAAGFDIVPHVAQIDYGKGKGSAQAWVDGRTAHEMPSHEFRADKEANHPDLHRIAALDFILFHTDRHTKNFMKGEDGRYYAIDNGNVIPKAGYGFDQGGDYISDPHRYFVGQKIHPEVKREIDRITPGHIRQAMKESGFGEEEAKEAQARLNVLQKRTQWADYPIMFSEAKREMMKV